MKQLCSAVTLVAALLPYSAVMAGETMLILGAGGSVMPAYGDPINTYFHRQLILTMAIYPMIMVYLVLD